MRAEQILPAQKRLRGKLDQPVGDLAEDREHNNCGHDLRWLAKLLAIGQQKANAFGCPHEFGSDHEHPSQSEASPQRDDKGRQHSRQKDAPDHREPAEAECPANLNDLAINSKNGVHHAKIDREKHADRDQRHF